MVVGDERFIYYIRDNVYGFAKIISHNSTERLIESPFEDFVRAYKKLKIAWTKFSLRVLLSLPTIQWKFLHRLNGTRTHDLSVEFFYFL